MIKGAAIAAGVLLIVVQVDEHYYSGFYTDGVLAMFHQIRDFSAGIKPLGHPSVGGLYMRKLRWTWI